MTKPPDIPPDTKDWTWVLDSACPQCGLDTRRIAGSEVAGLLRSHAATWQSVLGRHDLHVRPAPAVWSPLEYAGHVRDVCRIFDRRLQLMLTEDDPAFESWDQDAAAEAERYGEQEPAAVAVELGRAAEVLADRFAQVSGDQWQRTGSRSDGARFTVQSFARYFIHDVAHHLHDVGAHPSR